MLRPRLKYLFSESRRPDTVQRGKDRDRPGLSNGLRGGILRQDTDFGFQQVGRHAKLHCLVKEEDKLLYSPDRQLLQLGRRPAADPNSPSSSHLLNGTVPMRDLQHVNVERRESTRQHMTQLTEAGPGVEGVNLIRIALPDREPLSRKGIM